VKQHWVTQEGKRSETKISNIILHYRGFKQECYSETVLSEVHYNGGYLHGEMAHIASVTSWNKHPSLEISPSWILIMKKVRKLQDSLV
jgi:hypothetical protein